MSNVFKRIEKKYLVNHETLTAFYAHIEPHIEKDLFGQYTICNLYYDTTADELIRHSIEKPLYKEKLRLRSYGIPQEQDKVFLELKKKYKGTVFKRRISLPLGAAVSYLQEGKEPLFDNQIFREIDYFVSRHQLYPKAFLAYDRIAYTAKDDPNLRITVDSKIRSRFDHLDLSAGDWGEPLLADDQYLIEIKTSTAYPLWLAAALSTLEIYPTSFSKYGQVFIKNQKENDKKCLRAS